MKKVLIISATDKIGGAEIVLNNFLKENNEHIFYLITNNQIDVKKFYCESLNSNNIFVNNNFGGYYFKRKPFKSIKKLYRAIKEIDKIVKEKKIDVLYGNNTKDLFIVALYKTFINSNIKIISHIHDMLNGVLHKIFFTLFGNKIDLYVTPSKACANVLAKHGVSISKIHCIHNGINMQQYIKIQKKFNKDIINIGFVGRISKLKRLDIFVNVLKVLKNKNDKKYKGYVAGPIEDEVYFINQEIDKFSNIKYLGNKENNELINNIYPQISALLLCSDSDTLPTVVLEAMSFGCVVFARNVDGVPEIITNGEDGIIFDYNAKPEAIAQKIYDVFSNVNLVNALSKNAIKKIKSKFSEDYKKNKINKLIGEL